ncbi:MAG: hypothetical protein US42_C0006G0015 [Candidatus Magasanikbacteria bacterium GW2011_GWC2_37_14]|uniref:DUF4012 domain-containing protein n=1 Tax=Candidatus Magasanikbacteria bacterium GW2011_GWC2_37_14 TaxID=1619046 RepID=A0A0G0G9D5_9BACT|nr:MAG: hypothetical protein US42_C0006G0015 [Candidatus Magasanikbacteria bacterium GW2011_GWC2_37_14]
MNKIIKIILGIVTFFVLALAGLGVGAYFWLKNLTPEKIINFNLVKNSVSQENQVVLNLLPKVLGYTKPMNYLILFANNTELRPGGGFIGAYGVIKLDQGKMEILKVDGTENLDRYTPEEFKLAPPVPLKDNLKVDRWYFRDSNWSPDFAESAKKSLELYIGENGVAAKDIDAVIAFTPTVLEKILETIGPVTVQGIEFNAKNVTEKLEYEVEYGYDDKGIAVHERKQIIQPLFLAILNKLKNNLFFNLETYFSLGKNLLVEKQVMAYALDPELEKIITDWQGDGRVKETIGDYLLWVDANLAALKTDYAIKRNLTYTIKKQTDGRFLATAQMEYKHIGKFDWRTTRYRTYTRIFVPLGVELLKIDGSMNRDKSKTPGAIDQGQELNKQWFGTFISIEPGTTKTLSFSYYLPENIVQNNYSLLVQKQLGTIDSGLTLSLDFGKNIVSARPAEIESKWLDSKYEYNTELKLDKTFNIQLSDSK